VSDLDRVFVAGDPGFSSCNLDYTGPADRVIEYRLDNGQVDEYPAFWALPVGEVKKAIQHFLHERACALDCLAQ
jgi:hypothetical protein